MVNNGGGTENRIEYVGMDETSQHLLKIGLRGATDRPFQFGDQMEYVGYATLNRMAEESERVTQVQGTSQTIQLQFAVEQTYGLPCPDMPTLTDVDDNVYHTVLIGNQCWMKENLKTTRYADGTPILYGNDTSSVMGYWYYPNNTAANKAVYGLLYNWPALMRGAPGSLVNPSGVQGACPTGWHVPSDAEWKQLEMAAGMSLSEAEDWNFRGNIAANLAGDTGWLPSDTANSAGDFNAPDRNVTGFSALPAGRFLNAYNLFGSCAYFWTATNATNVTKTCRIVTSSYAGVDRIHTYAYNGFSVRCVRDEEPTPITDTTQNDDTTHLVYGQPCQAAATLTDIDGNTYNTVQIGNQCWMKENLRTTHYADGAAIQNGVYSQYDVASWHYPNNDPNNATIYGLLYNWTATMRAVFSSAESPSGVQGVCPTGWHVPSLPEWMQMRMTVMKNREVDEVDDVARIAATLSGNTGWVVSTVPDAAGNTSAFGRNASGFTALPAGWYTGAANGFGYNAAFWSTTYCEGDGYAYRLFLGAGGATTSLSDGSSYDSYSVRCVRNDESIPPVYDLPCPGMPTLTDVDGNTYNTILIGEQCWMKENLRTTKYADETPIQHGNDTSTTVGYWYYVNNDPVLKPTHGLLYNWKAAMRDAVSTNDNPSNVQGICPTGWHLPSDDELMQLAYYLADHSEYRCSGHTECIAKAVAAIEGWYDSDEECYIGNAASGNNITGFNALSTGEFAGGYGYTGLGFNAAFWSCTAFDSRYSRSLFLDVDDQDLYTDGLVRDGGIGVRCLRNE